MPPRARSPKRLDGAVGRAQKFRIYPTPAQAEQLELSIAAARSFYNEAIAHLRAARRHGAPYEGRMSMGYAVSAAVKGGATFRHDGQDHPYSSVAAVMLHGALLEVDLAYRLFFEQIKRGEKASPPRFRSRDRGPWSVRYQVKDGSGPIAADRLLRAGSSKRWRLMNVPKVGAVKVRCHRELPGDSLVGYAIVGRTNHGEWWVVLQYETVVPERERTGAVVGVDRGVARTVVTSDGEWANVPSEREGRAKRRYRLQRQLARQRRANPCPADTWVVVNGRPRLRRGQCQCAPGGCWRRSQRYRRTLEALSRLDGRLVNARNDAAHKITARLAEQYDYVVMEALDTSAMTASARGTEEAPGTNVAQKRGLNRSISTQGWYRLEQYVGYKTDLVKVPAHYTSQTCPECGVVDAASRPSQSVFRCTNCGTQGNADVVAANNILRRAIDADLLVVGDSDDPAGAQSVAARGAYGDGRAMKRERSLPSRRSMIDKGGKGYELASRLVPASWGLADVPTERTSRRASRRPRSNSASSPSRREDGEDR